jgi:hypothetical protein
MAGDQEKQHGQRPRRVPGGLGSFSGNGIGKAALILPMPVAISPVQISFPGSRGQPMAPRRLATLAFALSFGYCAGNARADGPAPVMREPVAFRDLTPPTLPEENGGTRTTTCVPESPPADGGLFGSAEYLLLRPRRAAFDFAISDATRDLVPNGKLESLNYELRSGVRAGLGYQFSGTRWDSAFEYTYFRSSADRTIAAPAGGTLYATLTRAGLNDEAAVAAATAGIEYNVFDAVMGRRVCLDDTTSLRFFGGVRFASVRQNFSAQYDGGDANMGRVDTSTNFDGFGPLVGGEISINLHAGFHAFARGSAALMTGQLRNPITETNNAGLTTYANLDYSVRRVIPVAGLAIGGGWQHNNVTIRCGYEITNWFGMIDSPRFTGELAEGKFITRSGDLSLEGLFAQVGISY